MQLSAHGNVNMPVWIVGTMGSVISRAWLKTLGGSPPEVPASGERANTLPPVCCDEEQPNVFWHLHPVEISTSENSRRTGT